MDNESELTKRAAVFLDSFEIVFGHDWWFTKDNICDRHFIAEDGTFLDPYPGEHFTGGKGDNWCNRSSLLAAYRELKAFMISEGIHNQNY
ncbi:hypothetical protein [Microcoleus vaginatus]|uniref:hypothetical protein n=1 Tax=Microcoleus vaginatus TaxID=119532 RepID=UPI0032A67083